MATAPMTRKRRKTTARTPDPLYPYMDELNADMRLVGGPTVLTPFPQNDSAARLDMFRSHSSQAVIVNDCDFPAIFTGKEQDFGRYEMQAGAGERRQDGQIIAAIQKYPVRTAGIARIFSNPRTTVIYRGLDDDTVHCFDVDSHAKGASGFGWVNLHPNNHLMHKDTYLPKDALMSHSPARQGNKYCLGLNLNVAYITSVDTIKDSMYISEHAAKRMESTAIDTITIDVGANEHPINHYGTLEDARFLPDIGGTVGDDGILCALRPVSTGTFAADMNPTNMCEIQPLHDRIIKVPPGAKIVDLNFYTTSKRDQIPWSVYGQVEKYVEAIKVYWEQIITVYNDVNGKYPLSPRFRNLVSYAMMHLAAHGGRIKGIPARRVRFLNRTDHPVEFLRIEVTYTYTRTVGEGFKMSDRHGTKGVICRIVPDEDMPIDDNGIRADVIIDPASILSRMNAGHPAEQAINRVSEFVRRRLADLYPRDPQAAAEMLLDYFNDVHPNYADLVRRVRNTPEKRQKLVEDAIRDGIYINIPPFLCTFDDDEAFERMLSKLERDNPKQAVAIRQHHGFAEKLRKPETYEENLFLYLKRKWNVPITPVTYAERDEQGNRTIIRTNQSVCIGSKYFYLLCKVPEPSAPGVAHVSHHGIPMKTPGAARMESEISMNPTRFGEDEQRIALQDVDGEEVYRLMSLQSASPTGVNLAIETLLTHPHPTQIDRFPISNSELRDTNSTTGLFEHIMATQGIDTTNTAATPDDFPASMLDHGESDALLGIDDDGIPDDDSDDEEVDSDAEDDGE